MGASCEDSAYNHAIKILSGQGAGPVLAMQVGGHGGQAPMLTATLPHPHPTPAQIFVFSVSQLVQVGKRTSTISVEWVGGLSQASFVVLFCFVFLFVF